MQNNLLQLVYQQIKWNGRYTACPVPGAAGCFSHFFVITSIRNTLGFLELNKPFVCLLWALSVCLCHMVQCEAGNGHLFNLGFLPLLGESKVIESTYPHIFDCLGHVLFCLRHSMDKMSNLAYSFLLLTVFSSYRGFYLMKSVIYFLINVFIWSQMEPFPF